MNALLAQLVWNVTSTGRQMMMPLMGFMTLDVALLLSVFDGLSQELLGLTMNMNTMANNNMTMVTNGTNSTSTTAQVDADAANSNHMCTMAVMELYNTTSLLLMDNVTAMMAQMELFNENLMIGVSELFESLGLDGLEPKETEQLPYFEGGPETWLEDKEEKEEEAPTTNETVPVPVVSTTVTVSDPRWNPVGGKSQAFQVLGDLASPSASPSADARAIADTVKVGLVTTTTTHRVVLATFVENMAMATTMGGSDLAIQNRTTTSSSDAAIVLQLLDLDVTHNTGSTNATTNATNRMVEPGVFPVPSTSKRTGFALASHSWTAAFGTALLNNHNTTSFSNKYSEDDLLVSSSSTPANINTSTSLVHVIQFDPLSNEWNREYFDAPLRLSAADSLQCGRDGRNNGGPSYHFGQILAFSNNGQTLVAAVSAANAGDAETFTSSANTTEADHANDASDADCILVFERTLTSDTDTTGAVSWKQKGSTLAGLPSLESLSVSDNGMAFVAILKHNSNNKRRSSSSKNATTRPSLVVPVSQSQARLNEGDNNTSTNSTGNIGTIADLGMVDKKNDDDDDDVPDEDEVQAIVFAFDEATEGWNATAKIFTTSAAATAVSLSGDGSMVAVGSPGDAADASASLGVTLYAAAAAHTGSTYTTGREERKREWKACFGDGNGNEDQRLSCEDCKALVQSEIDNNYYGGDLLKTVQIVQWDAMVTLNYDTSRVRIFCRDGKVDSVPILG
jgi:hypothetical protein